MREDARRAHVCDPQPVPDREGIVYISRDIGEAGQSFVGHWERGDPPKMLEEGPGWDDPEHAIAWGRERADRVLIRLGDDETSIYSAGLVRLTRYVDGSGDPYPEWPSLRRHS